MSEAHLRLRRPRAGEMAADLREPLLERDSSGEQDAKRNGGSDGSWGAPEEGGQSALTTHVAEPGDWGAFVQSLVANCVHGCRILIVTIGHCVWPLLPRSLKGVHLTPTQAQHLEELQARIRVPYDTEDPQHQEALRRLWGVAFPEEPWVALRTERWKDMGWQGSDPATDFRGGGYLALENHLYMAHREPVLFTALREKQNAERSEWEYPFAVAGVNITFMLVELLDLRDSVRPPSSAAGGAFLELLSDSRHAFEEVYCGAFEVLDRHWLAIKATYMEFPIAMRKTRESVSLVLCSGVRTVAEFRTALSAHPV